MEEMIERLQKIVKDLQNQLSLLEKETFEVDKSASLSEQIKGVESLLEKVNKYSTDINFNFNELSNVVSFDINSHLNNELAELRQKYLLEETDTPREAYDNLVRAMENAPSNDLLLSVKKFLESQLPPTEEVIEEIPFETAKIVDNTLEEGQELVEVDGVNGQVKIIYEIIDGDKKEYSREVILEPVTKVIRVHTL